MLFTHEIVGDMEQIHTGYRLEGLMVEHRDLDHVISKLACQPNSDNEQIKRLKKRMLIIKDIINRLKLQIDSTPA